MKTNISNLKFGDVFKFRKNGHNYWFSHYSERYRIFEYQDEKGKPHQTSKNSKVLLIKLSKNHSLERQPIDTNALTSTI